MVRATQMNFPPLKIIPSISYLSTYNSTTPFLFIIHRLKTFLSKVRPHRQVELAWKYSSMAVELAAVLVVQTLQ